MNVTDVPQLSKIPIGSHVILITSIQFRYEGTVAAINAIEDTIILKNVRYWGVENRADSNSPLQSGDSNRCPVGSLFDSVTFWMTNVIKLKIVDDLTQRRNELSDNAVKATTASKENTRPRVRNTQPVWQMSENTSTIRNSYRGSRNGAPRLGRQFPNGRQFGSYARRGKGNFMQQPTFVPFTTIQPQDTTFRRQGQLNLRRSTSYRFGNRTSRQNMHNGGILNGGGKQVQTSSNTGMLVYLPPEIAASYQTQGIAMFPQIYGGGRRRNNESRIVSIRGSVPRSSSSLLVDCSVPYDFESANAELEVELAKMHLSTESGAHVEAMSSVDRHSSIVGAVETPYNGSGASGDSSTEAIASTINAGHELDTGNTRSNRSLAKGEFYVPDKCFYDTISRSEGGPRGPGILRGRRCSLDRCAFSAEEKTTAVHGGGNNRPTRASPLSTARRERQLNIETFGPLATRNIFSQRRRPTGSVPRDLLVSATA